MLSTSFLHWKLIFLFTWSITLSGFSQIYHPKSTTALLGALDEEIELLRLSLQHPKTKIIHGLTFYQGKIGTHRVQESAKSMQP